ncbi:MAG: lytic transglycosylase domain-containing protein, partial [Xanthomonadales bacterium]|nr:lytic transglycosylase domain-containing protein [Xanthomonadales bacterium]
PPAVLPPPAATPLTEEELAAWDATWQAWDGFATWLVKTLAFESGSALNEALAETLLEARYELRDALARDDRDRDPVRELFLKTWDRLAPLVQDIQPNLPGSQALRYATFLGAGDALHSLDQLAPHLGLRLDRDSLRSMARLLVPGVSDYDLRYDTAVDPELRILLGLDPDFDEKAEDSAIVALLDWLIGSAHAAQIRPELLRQLDGWVPRRPEIDDYLHTVGRLLDAVASAERDRGKLPPAYLDLYDALLRATAWQESCWRQYVVRAGEIETIRSPAGSVGLMQINTHVWRGIYDLDALLGDIGYNARAGSEILVHYLVDYAIRKLERDSADDQDSLARATYAVYNGGPRHLTRIGDPKTSASLRKIDNAFWQKYLAIQSEGPMAVKRCLAG